MLPQLISLQKDVEEGYELAHCGDEGDLWLFTGLAQAMMEGFDGRLMTHGRERCHIERASHARSTTADMALAAMQPRIAIDWGYSDESGNLLGTDMAELRQLGENDGGGEVGNARHAHQDIAAFGEFRIGLERDRNSRIDTGELAFERRQALLDPGFDDALGVFEPILLSDHHIDQLTPSRHQGAKRLASWDRWRQRPRLHDGAKQSDRLGVDCIGLGEFAPRPCQVAHLTGIDYRNGNLGALKRADQSDAVSAAEGDAGNVLLQGGHYLCGLRAALFTDRKRHHEHDPVGRGAVLRHGEGD